MDLRDPVQWPTQFAASARFLDEGERGLDDRHRVHDPQQHRGRIGHLLQCPPTAQLQLLAGSLAPLLGGKPHPHPAGSRQRDLLNQALGAQLDQRCRVGFVRTSGASRRHLQGGGHLVLRPAPPMPSGLHRPCPRPSSPASAPSVRCGAVLTSVVRTAQASSRAPTTRTRGVVGPTMNLDRIHRLASHARSSPCPPSPSAAVSRDQGVPCTLLPRSPLRPGVVR